MAVDFHQSGVPLIRLAGLKPGADLLTGCNYLDPEKVEAKWQHFRVEEGDVLLSTSASLGEVAIVSAEGVGAVPYTGIIRFRPKGDKVAQEFIQYALRSPGFKQQIIEMGVGSVMNHFGPSHLKHMKLTLPTIEQQRGIAAVLGALDAKIAANTRKESTAASLIEAMYQRAVRAPGTVTEPLMEILTVAFGEPFGGAQFVPAGKGRPLIRIRDLKTFSSQVWTTESRPKEVLVQPGDVVVGMDAEFRPTWWLGKPGLLNQRVCRVTADEAGPAFVREALRAPMGRIEGYKTGTTVIHLNKSDLLREHILWPMADVRADFDRRTEPVLRALVAGAQERDRLAAMRDALLPELMSGRIRVKDAERVVEGAV
ncbi:restriction endonuclease subunit S [Pedococcus bigeumensis]|uniref:restriction endonuclease subunit S n=1 Tax=Pedococcus bigeumensis TaxID=433644 RepID=UPI0031DAEA69